MTADSTPSPLRIHQTLQWVSPTVRVIPAQGIKLFCEQKITEREVCQEYVVMETLRVLGKRPPAKQVVVSRPKGF